MKGPGIRGVSHFVFKLNNFNYCQKLLPFRLNVTGPQRTHKHTLTWLMANQLAVAQLETVLCQKHFHKHT